MIYSPRVSTRPRRAPHRVGPRDPGWASFVAAAGGFLLLAGVGLFVFVNLVR